MAEFDMALGAVTDEALLAGMEQGDEGAASAFVRRYQRRVFGLARSMLGDVGLAEEIAQEALLRVWRHAAIFDPRRGSVATWVLTITRNLAIDALRARGSAPADFFAVGQVSTERLPEDAVDAWDAKTRIGPILATLPAAQRRALVLAAVYGRTAAEIAASESIPLGTAKTRIRTGMAKLRTAIVAEEPTR